MCQCPGHTSYFSILGQHHTIHVLRLVKGHQKVPSETSKHTKWFQGELNTSITGNQQSITGIIGSLFINTCCFSSFLSFLSAFSPNVEIFQAVGQLELCLSTQTFLGKRREMKFPLSPRATIVSTIEITNYKLHKIGQGPPHESIFFSGERTLCLLSKTRARKTDGRTEWSGYPLD